MIINRSGIAIRLSVADCRVMGRATQGVRLINLAKKNDVIASVCKVMSSELEASVEEESKNSFNEKQNAIVADNGNEAGGEEVNSEAQADVVADEPVDNADAKDSASSGNLFADSDFFGEEK